MSIDLYEILGVRRDSSQKEIETAYKKLALQYHPDRHPDNPLAHLAEERMKEINQAYSVLKDPVLRRQYDAGTLRGFPPTGEETRSPYAPPEDEYIHTVDFGGPESYRTSGDSRVSELQRRSLLLFNQRNYESALWLIDELLIMTPDDPGAHNLRGLALLELRNYKYALVSFNNAIRIDNSQPVYRMNRAACFIAMKRPQQAIEDLKIADMQNPGNPEIMVGLAFSYQIAGQHLKAREYIKRARLIDPNHPAVLKYEAHKRQRDLFRYQYYLVPGCGGSCTNCICTAALCDACCIPGGCCMI